MAISPKQAVLYRLELHLERLGPCVIACDGFRAEATRTGEPRPAFEWDDAAQLMRLTITQDFAILGIYDGDELVEPYEWQRRKAAGELHG